MVLEEMMKAGVAVRARDMLYKAVVQAVLIYGSEIWVITDTIMNFLEGFHQRSTQSIMGKTEQQVRAEGW